VAKRGSAQAKSPLSRERIADAAMVLIDRHGLAALSIRKLAEELGCEAMSLYHHFPSKGHLLDALVDQCIAGADLPAGGLPWVEQLRRAAHGFRRMALRHPKFAPLLVVHRLNTPIGVAYLDKIIGIFRKAGFDDKSAGTLFRDVSYFLMGAVLDESSGYANGPSAAEPVSDAAIARDCPNLAAVAPFFKPVHFDATFEAGLEILLQGFDSIRKTVR
jgi:AcrR family transcriptional regulator